MKQEKILGKIKERLPLLKAKYHVKRIGIFGSFAREEQKKGSDVDVLVEFDAPIGFFERLCQTLNNLIAYKSSGHIF